MTSFTICSNNYIHKAQVLGSSVKELSGTPVYLFLADGKEEEVAYEDLNFTRVIYLDELAIPNLQWMKENYSIVEFNTAIKPFAFRYLLDHTNAVHLYYFDPDIRTYQPLDSFQQFWGDKSILLTPHILSPIPLDGKFPGENLFLNHGIYNLGFLALKRGDVTDRLLEWWSERMLTHCKINLGEGYFVDQLWFNLVPLLFGSTGIITHRGCNMAYWNLHERTLSLAGGNYMVNGAEPLLFYHFSGIDTGMTDIHSIENFRYAFSGREPLKSLYQEYLSELTGWGPDFYKRFSYFHGQYPLVAPSPSLFERVIRRAKSGLK